MLATPDNGVILKKEAKKLFDRFHVDIFHTIDVKRSDKDFKGLTTEEIKFLDEFAFLSQDALERGFVCVLKKDDYIEHYANKPQPKRSHGNLSMYTIIARAAIGASIEAAFKWPT